MGKNNNTNTNQKMLTAAEKERLEQFEMTAAKMVQQGYTRRNLTINMGFANVFSIVLMIPLFVISYGLYYLVHHDLGFSKINLIVFVVSFIVLIVVHELIHGICWSIFTPNEAFHDPLLHMPGTTEKVPLYIRYRDAAPSSGHPAHHHRNRS